MKSTAALRESGRAWEDAGDATQDALADRDAADDELDEAAKTARAALAGRSGDAVREEPYVSIFPHGASYYTAAPVDEEAARYGELKQRLAEHLPASDAVRKSTIKAIDAGVAAYAAAKTAVDEAHTAESIALTRLTKATDAWTRQLEKTYGALVGDLGRARADTFFPRLRGKTKGGGEADPAADASEPNAS